MKNKRKRQPTDETDRVLKKMYSDGGGDLTKLSKAAPESPTTRNRRRLTLFIVLSVMLLSLVSFAGFLFFADEDTTAVEDVEISISGETSPSSGETYTLEVTVENNESVPIAETSVTMRYPSGFRYQQATWSAEDEQGLTFRLGTISSRSSKTITITGLLTGAVNAEMDFQAAVRYQPANFSSVFERKAAQTITIGSSAVSVDIEGPTTAQVGQQLEYTVTVKNTSARDADGLRVDMTFPDRFEIESVTPDISDGIWRSTGPFPGGERQTFSIIGSFKPGDGDTQGLTVEAFFEPAGTSAELQQSSTMIVFLVNPDVKLSVTSRGLTVVRNDPGDVVTVDVTVTNEGDTQITNAVLMATLDSATDAGDLDGSFVDGAPDNVEHDGVSSGNVVSWAANQWDELKTINPGQTISTSFQVPIVETLPPLGSRETHPRIQIVASVKSDDIQDIAAVSTSSVFEIRLSSAAEFSAAGMYYDESFDPVGSGPIPPMVGETTTYRVLWSIETHGNELNNVVVRGTISPDAAWTGASEINAGSPLVYDDESRIVRWELGSVPANRRGDNTITAWFDVSLTPDASDVGFVMDLVTDIELDGTDGYTERSAFQVADVITTDLPDDTKGSGNGRIVAAS